MDKIVEQEPSWIELTVRLEKGCAETVADWIMEQGSTGIAEEADPGDSARVILKGYLANGEGVDKAVEEIGQRLLSLPDLHGCSPASMKIGGLQDEDWNKKWKSFFQPISITDRTAM